MLNKLCLLLTLVTGLHAPLDAQITKEFVVKEKEGFNLVKFDFSSYKGTSVVAKKSSGQPLKVHAHLAKVNILPSFTQNISGKILNTSIDHRNVESENLGKTLSYRLFSEGKNDFDHSWFIDLDPGYLYDLNFNLGIGKTNFDLSEIPVSKCKIKTASADVSLDYSARIPNSVRMDTMMVAIKMGSLEASGLNYSNAEKMIFDVNYGTLDLSFDDEIRGGSTVWAMVGAGSVNIDLPSDDIPYIIRVKSTAMCRTSIPKYLRDLGNKTYASRGYDKNADNLLVFLIDISVGSVSLK